MGEVDLKKLHDMLRLSAPVTHPLGNRRYKDFVFDLRNKKLCVRISKYKIGVEAAPSHKYCGNCDEGKIIVWEEHEDCHGEGCPQCDQGQVRKVRKCQCVFKKKY